MTLADFSHWAMHGGEVWIYKTPDSTSYTIGLLGSRYPAEVTGDSARFNLPPELAWGLIWRALNLIAEMNGDSAQADRYDVKAEIKKAEARRTSARKNKIIDRIGGFNFR